MNQRREFLKQSAAGVAGTALLPFNLMNCTNPSNAASTLSVQLYTIREEIEKDAKRALKNLADIGFRSVETAFWPKNITLDQAAGLIREHGFSVSSCHIEIPVREHQKTFLDTSKAYHCNKLIWHGWPEDPRYSTLEGTVELARIYNEAAQFAQDNGISFGLHNHWWEFRNDINGKKPFEILLEELDENIFFELDTYWIKVAGLDPSKIIEAFGKRAEFLHIKDGPAKWHESLAQDNPDPMTSVGKGAQDMKAILQEAANHPRTLVVEMDKVEGDVFEKLRESFQFLNS